jgi:hypothetical protein
VRRQGPLQGNRGLNISDAVQRAACVADLKAARNEGQDLCREQRDGRFDACKLLGEGRYDPDFAPPRFDDPRNPTNPNPYFPVEIGNRWEYHSANEINTVEIVNESKLIAGVGCIVARDLVMRDGNLAEATDDWFASAKDGAVWYCGEEVKDFETFPGDDPMRPELVSIEGSFKAGRDGANPGIIFLATPTPDAVYLEEFSLANAEDVTVVLSTTYAFGSDPELDQLVPQQLADRFCAGDCVVTRNFSLLEPGVFARKYYVRGIGVFLEVEPDENNVSQLVSCNFDPRCVVCPRRDR